MEKLTLADIFKALKVERNKETLYRLMDKITDPLVKEELIKYLGGANNE